MASYQLCVTELCRQTRLRPQTYCQHLARKSTSTRQPKPCLYFKYHLTSPSKVLPSVAALQSLSYTTSSSQIVGFRNVSTENITSVEELLSHADKLGSRVEPLIPAILDKLVSVHYKVLYESSPWLQTSTKDACRQLLLVGMLKEKMQPVTDSPAFKKLLQVLENRLDNMPLPKPKNDAIYWDFRNTVREKNTSDSLINLSTVQGSYGTKLGSDSNNLEIFDLPHVHLSLFYLGLDESEPVMQSLWLLSQFNIRKMNYRALYYFLHQTRENKLRWTCLKEVLEVHDVAMNCPPLNIHDLVSFASIVKTVVPFLPADQLASSLTALEDASNRICCKTSNLNLLASLVQTLQSTFTKIRDMKMESENRSLHRQMFQILHIVFNRVLELIDLLSPHDLGAFARFAKRTGLYYTGLRLAFSEKALTYLSPDLCFRDASNLILCLDHNVYPEETQQVIHTTAEQLYDDKYSSTAPVILTEMATRNLMEPDVDIIHKFIMEHMNNNRNNPTFLQPVMEFLSRYPFRKQEDKEAFTSFILEVLDTQPHFAVSDITLQAFKVLADADVAEIPERLHQLVMKTLTSGKHRSRGFFNVFDALIKFRNQSARASVPHLEIQQQVFKSMIKQQTDIREDVLSRYVRLLIRDRYLYDAASFSSLMELYVGFTSVSRLHTQHAFHRITTLFHSISYFIPEMLDNLTLYVLANPHLVNITNMRQFLSLLALFGYSSKDFEQVLPVIWRLLDAVQSDQKPCYEVQILCDLAMLQCFPESRLQDVFTVEYMERLEKSAGTGNEERGQPIEAALKQLNRAVILECPHMGVPWFSENLPAHKPSTMPYVKSKFLNIEVKQYLASILGGPEHLQSEVKAQYGYKLDMEFVLDKKRQPVPYSKELDSTFQKVAVLLLQPGDYCFNVPRLKGDVLQKVRHLQIMGYEVVEIPHSEWGSMGSQSEEARMEYLANKVFHEETKKTRLNSR